MAPTAVARDSSDFGRLTYVATLMTDVILGALVFLTVRLIAAAGGVEAADAYQVGRGLITLGLPLALAGSTVLLARQLPTAGAGHAQTWIRSSGVVAVVGATVIGLAIIALPSSVGLDLVERAAVAAYLLSVSLGSTAVAAFRGFVLYRQYNLSRFVLLGTPLVLSASFTSTTAELFGYGSVMQAAVVVVALPLAYRHAGRRPRVPLEPEVGSVSTTILTAGLPRGLGDLSLYAVLAGPTLAAGAVGSGGAAAVIGLGASVVTLSVALLQPASTFLLPWARKVSQTNPKVARRAMKMMALAAAINAGLALGLAAALAGPILQIVSLPGGASEVTLLRSSLTAIPGYACFVALRSFVDSDTLFPRNAINATIGLASSIAIFGLLTLVGVGDLRFGFAQGTATTVLALCTLVSLRW